MPGGGGEGLRTERTFFGKATTYNNSLIQYGHQFNCVQRCVAKQVTCHLSAAGFWGSSLESSENQPRGQKM
jgi:hypothetical protein